MSSLYQTPRYRQVLPSFLAAKVEAKITVWESVPMTVLQRFKHNGALVEFAFTFHHKTLFPLRFWLFG